MSAEATLQPWERWVGSTARPVVYVKRGARVELRAGVRWIIYRDALYGTPVVVSMPSNAPTKSCDHDRHDKCPHRLGGPQEGGVVLKLSLPGFIWRCGCPCHNDPHRAGRLF